jgi:putative endonuclease
MPDPRHTLGQRGEAVTATWLESRGWTILARRWRCREGEIDLVALDPIGTLVAVEVKLRSGERSGGPLASIDGRRLRRLRGALARFGADVPPRPGTGMRLDLVAVSRQADGRWRLHHHRAIDAW